MDVCGYGMEAKPAAELAPIEVGVFAQTYPLRILVAEDDYITRRVVRLSLESMGYKPITVENGAECFEAACPGKFDVILSDIEMPVMDGIDCARSIRAAELDVYIIAMTANRMAYGPEHCFQAGFNAFLPKPFNVKTLQEKLREAWLALKEKKKNVRATTNLSSYLQQARLHLIHV